MHTHLNKEDRACIAALLRKKYTYSEISRVLGFHPSTISREVRRNSTDTYRVHHAHRMSIHRRMYARIEYRCIDTDISLETEIHTYLKQHWSPQQIQNRLDISSTSSIYRYIERNTHLKQYLRRQGKRRRKYGTRRIPSRYQANKRSIHDRPSISSLGHWEGDTILGSERKLRIVTYVDKVSGYLVAHKATGSADVIHFLAKKQFRHMLCNSITYDNGSEFALHKLIERDCDTTVYFADLGSPHQRGANENCNGLLRQYFPKGSSFVSITNTDVQRAVNRLNNRPRKRLNYLTPREVFENGGVRLR